MKPSNDLRRIPQALRDVGAQHVATERGGKHYKVTFAPGTAERLRPGRRIAMEVKAEEEMAGLIARCLPELEEVEAAYIRGQYLDEPNVSLPEFALRWRLSKKAMGELGSRVAVRLQELLAKKQIRSIGDIV